MQGRQKLVVLVRREGWSIAAAARECGVSRPTAYKWLEREQETGLAALTEKSRRPHHLRPGIAAAAQEQVLELKARYPRRGAKKLHAMLWPEPGTAPLSVRSADRVLARAGLTQKAPPQRPEWQRFERDTCNELWQMDFKGMEKVWGYRPLSLLDDCSRFCLALEPLEQGDVESVWGVLWRVFGECGLPQCILSDNGDGFNSVQSLGPTPLQARLWRLGIDTTHGRVAHPQTQGKVERFHRSLEDEWREELRQGEWQVAQQVYGRVRHEYNWGRPHEALGQRVPGVVYRTSTQPRPARLPPAEISTAGQARKADGLGRFSFGNHRYLAGRGLAGEWVEIREEEQGHALFYANRRIAALSRILFTPPRKCK